MANIRAFQKQDTARVISTMAGAFADDPLYRYFIPEDAARERFLKKFMAFRLRYGCRYGKALMAHGLAQIQELSQPCYLETQSAANVAFYRSCGFSEVSRTPAPGTGVDHWGMLWEPHI